jgi:hypothetical protein
LGCAHSPFFEYQRSIVKDCLARRGIEFAAMHHDQRHQGSRPMLRSLKPGFGKAVFGAHLLLAFAVAPLVSAQEAHQATESAAVTPDESAFLRENEAAMTKMMNDMAAKPSGDIDRDFVAMMAPHHQGAIDMAVIELRYGKNEQLRRIAQEIIVDQQQEINAMKLAIGEPVATSAPAPTQPYPASKQNQHDDADMHMDMSAGMKK